MGDADAATVKVILLVDDRDDTRLLTKWFLTNFNYAVESARSAEEALSCFSPQIHDLVITDNSMPGMTGLELAHVVKLRSPSTPVLMYCGFPPDKSPAVDLVVKRPSHLLVLKEAVESLLAAKPRRRTKAPPNRPIGAS